MLRVENTATPPAADTDIVPDSVPPAGFVPSDIVTVPANPGTALPRASSATTCTAGEIVAPEEAVAGWTENAHCVAGPGATLNGALTMPLRPDVLAAIVYPMPVLLMLRPEKVATPAVAVTIVVPDSVPPPGFV